VKILVFLVMTSVGLACSRDNATTNAASKKHEKFIDVYQSYLQSIAHDSTFAQPAVLDSCLNAGKLTRQEFDAELNYLTKHPKELLLVLEKIDKKLDEESSRHLVPDSLVRVRNR
jgi:hypothetical protein